MLNIFNTISIFIFFACYSSFHNFDESNRIVGKWYTENNDGIVEIYMQGNLFYGKLIWLKNDKENGIPKKDSKNRNEKLKNRPLIGILIFYDMKYNDEEKRWEDGRVYKPDYGHDADCIIIMIDENTIEVKGYMGFSWISETQTWKRKLM